MENNKKLKEYKYCNSCYTKNIPTNQECSVCGCKLSEKIYKKNILLTIIFSLIIFTIVFLIYKLGFKSYGADMKKIEVIYYVITFAVIYSLNNNYFNKPNNTIAQLILNLPSIIFFVKPPENLPPGMTNLEFRKKVYHDFHERDNRIINITDAKSFISIMINIGILAILIFIYGFIAIPLVNVIQILTLFSAIIILFLIPIIVFFLSFIRKR